MLAGAGSLIFHSCSYVQVYFWKLLVQYYLEMTMIFYFVIFQCCFQVTVQNIPHYKDNWQIHLDDFIMNPGKLLLQFRH